ncbi:MAG: 2-oxoacid:acceptor oxidoreductase family protein [Candidatus Nanohaloarchaeota archaeon QJJ-9]|nr:2-oxoacid:acceptor oxidoreductase family protein [Candidatus Nanohaloarchaeota archaeon QJJ-9]
MELSILFGGTQGQGVDKVAEIAAKLFANMGYYIFRYRDYSSLIEGGHSFSVLSVSEKPIHSHKKELDVILALDEDVMDRHSDRLAEESCVLTPEGLEEDVNYNYINTALLGGLAKLFGVKKNRLEEVVEEELQKTSVGNKKAVEEGYQSFEQLVELEDKERSYEIMTGSQGVVRGAIESGMDVFLAYPMTPATPVFHLLAEKEEDEDYITYQLENELAVANAALGSAHTGAKTMVGTSGGGADLMSEATSMQGIAEIPFVLYLAQRAGAGSGVPTYTAQADLGLATKGGHGEFPRVVIAPGDAVESVEAANQAFYFAENYRLLSVILGDKHVAESDFTFTSEPDTVEVGRNIDSENQGGEYENYKITETGNSPRSVPQLNVVKSSSYEHDEKGITVEDAEKVDEMTEKRLRKGEEVEKESKRFERFKVHGDQSSSTVIIGWGSTKGVLKDVAKEKGYSFLQVFYLEPFPEEIEEHLKDAEEVVLVENNSTGLLGDLIAENTGIRIGDDQKILKYDGRPFRRDKLLERIDEVLG